MVVIVKGSGVDLAVAIPLASARELDRFTCCKRRRRKGNVGRGSNDEKREWVHFVVVDKASDDIAAELLE